MATRETFLQELKNLNQEVITMSQMVQDAIDSSFQALSEHNTELADKIIKGDRDVDNMERKIETHCLMLMLKQQPVASDLRHISTALKVVTDLERMGDQAADIADLSLRLEAADYGLVSKHLPAMVANVKTTIDIPELFIKANSNGSFNIYVNNVHFSGCSFIISKYSHTDEQKTNAIIKYPYNPFILLIM